jgi:hypothetical protein
MDERIALARQIFTILADERVVFGTAFAAGILYTRPRPMKFLHSPLATTLDVSIVGGIYAIGTSLASYFIPPPLYPLLTVSMGLSSLYYCFKHEDPVPETSTSTSSNEPTLTSARLASSALTTAAEVSKMLTTPSPPVDSLDDRRISCPVPPPRQQRHVPTTPTGGSSIE